MNIKEMTVEALKALGYDQMALIESAQINLKLINQELIDRNKTGIKEKEKCDDLEKGV